MLHVIQGRHMLLVIQDMESKDKPNMMLPENRFPIGLLGEKETRGSGRTESGMSLTPG